MTTDREVLQQILPQIEAIEAAITAQLATDPEKPPIEQPQPPTPIPPGNPGAIQPPLDWPMGQASSAIFHFPPIANGTIICYEVPPLHNGTGVAFTQGPGTNTQGGVVTEYSVSQTPGVIIDGPAGGPYYYKSVPGQNYNGDVINRSTGTMPYCPPGQTWYLNIRWTNPEGLPNSFSLQWAESANP